MFSIMKFNTKSAIMVVVAAVFVLQEPVDAASSTFLPSVPNCGQFPPKTRIIGGHNARRWPWHAQVLSAFNNDSIYHYVCGGTLINDEWVLLATHCIMDAPSPAHIRVILGDYNRLTVDNTEQYYNVSDFRVHYNYSVGIEDDNDIALIKLNRTVKYTSTSAVQPICLPKQNKRVRVGTKCYLTGWGYTRFTQNVSVLPEILQEVQLPVVNHSICKQGFMNIHPVVERSMLCAGYGKLSNKSGCYGDSGGPLSCSENGSYVLRGVANWVFPGCKTVRNTFTVFARVSSFIGWIQQQMTTPPPKFPECKDNHFACAEFAKKNYCTHWLVGYMVKNSYCPITCKNPKCITPSNKKNK